MGQGRGNGMTSKIEWPTLGLLLVAYVGWGCALFVMPDIALWLAVLLAALAITLHASLQHEVIHGHPTQSKAFNFALIWPPLTLVIPYLRFRDTHLAHHLDSKLTDPYDDPESNFLDQSDWESLSGWKQRLLLWNNTLAGRLVVGPLIGTVFFLRSDWQARGQNLVRRGWLWHVPAVLAVLAIVAVSSMPIWAYLLASYLALSILRIRTFLEHRAHDLCRARTVIVEDRGPLALLFLNNNLHAVHHMHPGVAWYDLPGLLRTQRDRFLTANEGYLYRSYSEVFRKYLFRRKDPVSHPLWKRK